ncbi:hypothetical protein QBE55_02010 [Eubacteriales bacterium mix99]
MQRLGRAGHRLNAVSKGRIIPRTCGDLLDSVVISREMVNQNIETGKVPKNALDIVSQHLVSMACTEDWKLSDIMDLLRSSWPFHTIEEEEAVRVLTCFPGNRSISRTFPASRGFTGTGSIRSCPEIMIPGCWLSAAAERFRTEAILESIWRTVPPGSGNWIRRVFMKDGVIN